MACALKQCLKERDLQPLYVVVYCCVCEKVSLVTIWSKKLNRSLQIVTTWCHKWGTSLTSEKTVCMIVTHKQIPSCFSYSVNGFGLNWAESYKYLGVIINSKLNWESHV